MPRKHSISSVFVPDHLKDTLKQISQATLTTVVAPMGYGKTTAITWFLSQLSQKKDNAVIRVSIFSDNANVFWKSAQFAFKNAGFDFLEDYPCPSDMVSRSIIIDALCRELSGDKDVYIFIDDYHLFKKPLMAEYISALANALPLNVHVILASRSLILDSKEAVRLGHRLFQIEAEDLRLDREDIKLFVHKCGIEMTDDQLDELMFSTEGWFSAIYLSLRTFMSNNELPKHGSDIYEVFTTAMINSLSDDEREIIVVMGIADEFTATMARHVTGIIGADKLLTKMASENAFIKKMPDGKTFRFHHMMKECAERLFATLPKDSQYEYRNRYGKWYEEHDQYVQAIVAYRKNHNYDALLRVMQADAGILLSCWNPSKVMEVLDECPKDILKKYPLTILVLMRCMFNFRQIPKMMELKKLLTDTINEHPDMSSEEKGNLLGECDLIMSFLMYNDIEAMSNYHRSASNQMSRPAVSISNEGGWTFGSPSVLMMFYRKPGDLDNELSLMDECMPYYYKVTDYHGLGAEKIIRAEAEYMRGNFIDAKILLEAAYTQLEDSNHDNMRLCCDYLDQKLSNYTDYELKISPEERQLEILRHHNAALINVWSASCAYYRALTKDLDNIPEIYKDHLLIRVNILEPGRPMIDMIENMVFLAQKDYTKVIGRSEHLLSICEKMHYCLVTIYVEIQTAGAFAMLGKYKEAKRELKKAISLAFQDNLIMPFVEHYEYIKDLLIDPSFDKEKFFISEIIRIGEDIAVKYIENMEFDDFTPIFTQLTKRENEIVNLMAMRLSNHEISEKLFISEGSVKQYSNQIYRKLQIEGDTRTKRQTLLKIMNENLTKG